MRGFILGLGAAVCLSEVDGFAPSFSGSHKFHAATQLHQGVGEAEAALAIPSNSTDGQFSTGYDGAVSLPTAQLQNKNTLATWQRRLITREDPFSLHKLASIGYTVTSAALLGTAAVQAVKGDFATRFS